MKKTNIEDIPAWQILTLLAGINLLLRLGLFNINLAEYTDGILQITLFDNLNALWPPFYTILAIILKPLCGSMESAAKCVSLISSIALMFPLFFLTQRLFNRTSATYALILYTISPDVLRWSIRVMTDALFTALFFCAVWLFLLLNEVSPLQQSPRHRRLSSALIIVSALATLTRYQGILLLPLVALTFYQAFRYNRHSLPLMAVSFLFWLLIPAWILTVGFSHTAQIAERTSVTVLATLAAYWNNFESFIAYFPYFLTYPIAILFLIGLFYTPAENSLRRTFIALFFYVLITILILQSVFSSFQSRYLLPTIPFILTFAGYGLHRIEQKFQHSHRWVFPVILAVTLLYGMAFSLAVMVFQRQTFGDIKSAALFVHDKIPPHIPVYSNEIYKPEIPCPKMRYWSGRNVRLYQGQRLPAGAIICLHSAYGGPAVLDAILMSLTYQYKLREVCSFEASILPLLPDVMAEPLSHQNPLAWALRYQPQTTITTIYQIEAPRSGK